MHPPMVSLPLTTSRLLSILGYGPPRHLVHGMPNENNHQSISVVDTPAILRRAREGRGESIGQASEGTRISVTYLEALESDAAIDAYPSALYARFFLRGYARYLGLDEEPLVEAFSRRHQLPEEAPPAAPAPEDEAISLPVIPRLPSLRPASRRTRRLFMGTRVGRKAPVPMVPAPAPVVVSPSRRVRSRPRIGRLPRGVLLAAVALPLAVVLLRFAVLPALDEADTGASGASAASPETAPQLPRGGRQIFPDYRVVAFYGAARTDELGILGIGPDLALERLVDQAAAYERPDRPVLPAFELIATVASGAPGPDGRYRDRVDDFLIGGYLDAAREAKLLLILDIQPGRSDFMKEIKVFADYLKEPEVGLAIDPEWHVGPGEVPGVHIGSTDAATINRVTAYLARIVRRYDLPQKLFIVHQFTSDMIKNKEDIKTRPELAMAFDVDGFGDRPNKISKYHAFTRGYKKKFNHGIKLYYERDTNLMTPKAVLRLEPEPDLIVYQ
jgi:hypothetical protein